jgi:multiple sugar transport system substrate-binding protein
MNKNMSRNATLLKLLVLSLLLIAVFSGAAAQEKVDVTWFVGLGTGTNPEQIAAQEAVVAAFNEANPDINLILNIAASNTAAADAMNTLIAAGDAPDIVGPVGNGGANLFGDSFLDIEPLVEAAGYDLTQFPEAAVDFYRTPQGLLGLPLAVFPAMLYYNRDLFEEAGLEYPPQEFGAPYILDGEEVEWNWDTLAEVGKILTVDANGNDATMEGFDPENIIQFGYVDQWSDSRNAFSLFGPTQVWNPEDNTVTLGDNFRESAKYLYNGTWTEYFIPNSVYASSELLQGGGGAFSSGNVAMARTHLWYTCCLGDAQFWDLAFLPTYNGTYTSNLHADTFRIMKSTENPEEAFRVLEYLTGEASLQLLNVYGGMPARVEDRAAFFAGLDERYPQGVNWAVAEESLNYPDIPSHEAWYPGYNKGQTRFADFLSLLGSTPDLDIDAEVDKLQADLQTFVDEEVGG